MALQSIPTGAIRYNTDSNKMECFNGTKWYEISGSSPDLNGGGRGVFAGGRDPSALNTIAYVEIASTGNATDFGDLTATIYVPIGACSSHIRGMWTGGYTGSTWTNSIQFITIATTGNAAEWGDLITTNSTADNERGGYMGATSDSHGGLS